MLNIRHSTATGEICSFLAAYSAMMLGCGATCIRLERNVRRMAKAFGRDVSTTIMPRHVHLSVWTPGLNDTVTIIASVPPVPISFNLNSRLSQLSWEVADCQLDLEQARDRYDRVIASDHQNKWLLLPLVAVANAAFCRLFNGDFTAMAVVFVATLVGYYFKTVLMGARLDLRVVVLVCAFVSALIACGAVLFNLGSTPMVAIGTSVLYLVPGIPFLNSFSDMLDRHYICAFSRFTDAMVLTGCLSAGLCAALMLMHVGLF